MENLNFIKMLDGILLSKNVKDEFYNIYNKNIEFKNWLDGILPEVEMCINQQQNNPWHKYGVMEHILHSVEEINKQTLSLPLEDRRLLAYVMFYHDLGKPACHIVREKDGKMIDSFFDHNIEGEKIVARTASKFSFNEKDSLVLRQLVLKHDTFVSLRSHPTNSPFLRQLNFKVVKEIISDFNLIGDGINLTKYLALIGRADNKAQNEKMTVESLKLIDNFENIIAKIETKKSNDDEIELN